MSADSEAVWAGVAQQAQRLKTTSLAALFERDPARVDALTFHAPHLTLDLSRQRLDAGALTALALYALAREAVSWRDQMFVGEAVNVTERRAARHFAVRGTAPDEEAKTVLAHMRALAARIHAGELGPIDAILHIGIGGSDLGPRLISAALRPYARANMKLRFVANIDEADFIDATADLDPARTFVIVVSKSFTTLETLANGAWARDWMGANASARLAAVTAAPERARAWGVDAEKIFPFWDWVGGRFSLWSAVGLSTLVTLQDGVFERLLAGAGEMDDHFREAPFASNAPMIAAALQAWNREALGLGSYALIPYTERLALLPAYLQQLEMESNGKGVTRDGETLARPASAVTWGAAGTNAQHSFFQMLHQGVEEIPVEFLLVKDAGGRGRIDLLANALAQAQALLHGKSAAAAYEDMRAAGVEEEEARRLAPHRTFPGDRASTILALEDLSPESLGALLAFYEHRTVAQAFLAGINPFDQFGVELGKAMAKDLTAALSGDGPPPDDPATRAWVGRSRG